MQLWYGPPSPFSRKVRVAIIECGLEVRVTTVPVGDGLMEALIFIKVPLRRPLGDETSAIIIERQKARIERSLDVLEAEAAEMQSEGANVGCIAVACALGWQDFNFPAWGWRATRPRLAAWFETFSKRASMRDTVPVRPGPGSEKVRGRTDI